MPFDLKVSPEGGAMMVGRDSDGNQVAVFWPEGSALPELGTLVFGDDGVKKSYFASNGWMPMPTNPAYMQYKPILVPMAEFDPFHVYELESA